eukprot:5518156-Amphidinium_carterae.2
MFTTIQPLLSTLLQDSSFAVAHVNILAVTNVRVTPNVDTLWQYMELLEGELGEKALDEQRRNLRKPQAHLNEVPQPPYDANGMEGKGKGKEKKGKGGKDKDQPKGKPKGDGKKGGRTGYRNPDDDPKDTRPICPKTTTPGRPGPGEYQYPDADHAYPEEEEYEEGTTWPEEGIDVPQADCAAAATYGPSSFTAYLCPDIIGVSPVAFLTTPEVKPMTPILDTGASHCLLPVSHLTADEAELASRITNSLDLTFLWHGGILIMTENGTPFEVIRATLWNSLPCVTEVDLKSLVEALTTFTLSSRVWSKADWEKALGIPSLQPLELSALPTEGKKDFQVTPVLEEEFSTSLLSLETGDLSAVTHEATGTVESKVDGELVEALPRTEAMPSILNQISSPEKIVLLHRLPKQPTRTNVVTEDQVPRSRLFGAYCVRGSGVTLSTIRYPEVVQACLRIADTRTKRHPFASMQLTCHKYLPCHQDKNNV